jgi:hypothetical protein
VFNPQGRQTLDAADAAYVPALQDMHDEKDIAPAIG